MIKISHLFKHLVLLVVIFVASHQVSFATHAMGADITYKCLGGNTYQITYSFYFDCSSAYPMPQTIPVNYYSTSCNYPNTTFNITMVSALSNIEVTPICPTLQTTCSDPNSIYPGVKQYIYRGNITLPMQCTDWIFDYSMGNRNGNINTINGSGNDSLAVYAMVNNTISPGNNSPVFSNLPVPYICEGQTYCYNNGAQDSDGDSLVYSMITPLTGNTNNPFNSVVTYSSGSFNAINPISSSPPCVFNGANGNLCMTPSAMDIGVMAFLVEEYRNGVLIGTVERDIQINVLNCINNIPTLSGINNTNSFTDTVCDKTPFSFQIFSNDLDAGQIDSMWWNNGIPGATFTVAGSPHPVGTFSWTPPANTGNAVEYCFTVSVKDNACPFAGSQTKAYCITVLGTHLGFKYSNDSCINLTSFIDTSSISGSNITGWQWNFGDPGSGGNNTSNLQNPTHSFTASGNYTVQLVTISDHGCHDTVTEVVPYIFINGLSATITNVVNATCQPIGSATVSATGGTAGYSYHWSTNPVQTSSTATGLAAGTYYVTVTDAHGCTDSVNVIILGMTNNMVHTDVTCNGGTNGTATITVTGGTSPFVYHWNSAPVQTTQTATGLAAGSYIVTVTDVNGCTVVVNVTITQPSQLTATIGSQNISCNGLTDGSASVTAGGGISGYNYIWSNGSTTNTATGLGANNYIVTVTDANGCTVTSNVTITQPTPVVVTIVSQVNELCFGGNNASITSTTSGGTGIIALTWSTVPIQNTLIATNLLAGAYIVTATDQNGCTATVSTTITEPTKVLVTLIDSVEVTCYGGNNGSGTVGASGGIPGYNYTWNTVPQQSGATAINMFAGSYVASATDANGCVSTVNVIITEPTQLVASISGGTTICIGQSTDLTVTQTGGTAPYTFLWNTGSAASPITVSPTVTTSYTVTVTDANNCTGTASATVTVRPPLAVSAFNNATICEGESIRIYAVPTGGDANYTLLWNNGVGPGVGYFSVTPLVTTTYMVTLTDGCGSPSATSQVTINVNPAPVVTFTGTNLNGCVPFTSDFLGQVSISSGSIVSTLWNFGDGGTTSILDTAHQYTSKGLYTVSLTAISALGCKTTLTKVGYVKAEDYPKAAFLISPDHASVLSAIFTFTDMSVGANHYLWNFGDHSGPSYVPNPQHQYTAEGVYQICEVVYNDLGCSDSTCGDITVDPEFEFFIPSAFTPNGDKLNDKFTGYGIGILEYQMDIWDRWGNNVFSTNDISKGWDGKVPGTTTSELDDVYVYFVKVTDFTGTAHTYMGKVTIIR
ncbi:MAG: PKD domain-containing protein [Bacteroidota bacterium]